MGGRLRRKEGLGRGREDVKRAGSDKRGTIDEYADVDALMRTAKQVYLLSMSLGSCGPLIPAAGERSRI